MASLTRFSRYVKDFWKVFIRGENGDLRSQTISMQEELARLRNRRMATDKEREGAALNQARGAVQRLRELHNSFLAAEVAASEFAAKMGEAAKSGMEANAETRQEACKKFFVQQKEMYAQEIKLDIEGETEVPTTMPELPSQLNRQEESGEALELKLAHDKSCVVTTGESLPNVIGEVRAVQDVVEIVGKDTRQDVEIVSKEARQPNTKADVTALDKSTIADNMVFEDEIRQDILAQMMQEVKKQVRCEETSQIDALARDRAMLEKEIEAREKAECASLSQGHH